MTDCDSWYLKIARADRQNDPYNYFSRDCAYICLVNRGQEMFVGHLVLREKLERLLSPFYGIEGFGF